MHVLRIGTGDRRGTNRRHELDQAPSFGAAETGNARATRKQVARRASRTPTRAGIVRAAGSRIPNMCEYHADLSVQRRLSGKAVTDQSRVDQRVVENAIVLRGHAESPRRGALRGASRLRRSSVSCQFRSRTRSSKFSTVHAYPHARTALSQVNPRETRIALTRESGGFAAQASPGGVFLFYLHWKGPSDWKRILTRQ